MTKDAAKEGTSPDRGLVAVAVTKVGKDMKSDIIDIDVEIAHRTEKAVLVHTGERDKAVWLPLSMIEMDPDHTVAGIATVTLPERLALEKGLI